MKVINSINYMYSLSDKIKSAGEKIALVPTMGFLHQGHLSLIKKAQKYGTKIVVSIYVNPTQFAPNEDLKKYPRNLKKDIKLLEEHNVDILFNPKTLYTKTFSTEVIPNKMTDTLCGKFRPNHFKGVTTIVTKLFNIIKPHYAIFGWKDAQQLIIIKRMVNDLNFPIKIIGSPIIRENDGLAMSSRNTYLTKKQRKNATTLYKALKFIKNEYKKGNTNSQNVIKNAKKIIKGKTQYLEAVTIKDLEKTNTLKKDTLIAVAVKIGKTRLIDNIKL